MIRFCENCGFKISQFSAYCENCGYRISEENNKEQNPINERPQGILNIFAQKDWENIWVSAAEKCGNGNLGIVLINSKGKSNNLNRFYEVLKEYIGFRNKDGIHYYLLDLADELVLRKRSKSVGDAIEILKKVYQQAAVKYLLIVGDTDLVGSAKWDNPCYVPNSFNGDRDKFVDSDLPYTTLDAVAPQSGRDWEQFDFEESVRVGRIPCRAENGFQEACRYFKNAMSVRTELRKLNPFALSAQVWQKTSDAIFNGIGTNLFTSPKNSLEDFFDAHNAVSYAVKTSNLLYFNLHGTLQGNYWYGQSGNIYPKAFSSECLPSGSTPYVIGTEACYGAKTNDDKSILLCAIQNGCLAYLGSSQIAYGLANGEQASADVVVGEFIRRVSKNYTFGDAYVAALNKLTKESMRDTELKTLAEFALYGDPSLTLFGGCGKEGIFRENNKAFSRCGIQVPMPDVRREVRLKLIRVNEKTEARIKQYIELHHKEFSECVPMFCEVKGYGCYQAIYSKGVGELLSIIKVYFDSDGIVKDVYVSK